MYEIKGWSKFQHYAHRNPPWIKLHKNLLDDYDFQSLPVASKALAPMLWLLASDHENPKSGFIEGPESKIAFRLRLSLHDFEEAIKPLIEKGFVNVASTPIAICQQVATTETEYRERGRDIKSGFANGKGNGHGREKPKSGRETIDRLIAEGFTSPVE